MADHIRYITLDQLRHQLQQMEGLPPETLITFGRGDLIFNRVKERGPKTGTRIFNFEFTTLYTVTHQPDED
jgi:hypothetical protein